MGSPLKYIYVSVLVLFLPAFTQSPAKDTVVFIKEKIDTLLDKKIDTVKRNATIDLMLTKITIDRIKKIDSIKTVSDSLKIDSTKKQ